MSLRLSRSSVLLGAAGIVLAAVVFISWALFAHADTGPTVSTAILNTSNTTTTSAFIGAQVHDWAQVASTTGSTTPSGSVTFNAYQNNSCSGSPSQQVVSLVGGVATSSATSTPASGLSYLVQYSGDQNYPSSSGSCEELTATASGDTIATALSTSTSVLPGSSVSDSATLSNETSNAGGSVTYTSYTNNTCTVGATSAGTVGVSNGTVPNSNSLVFNTPGTYYWQAVYSGDANNAPATSTCGNEVLTVVTPTLNSPTISTNLSTTSAVVGTGVNDTATLSGETGSAGGTAMGWPPE